MLHRLSLATFLVVMLPLWAQTSGATAPEVTQFKPVDITDLVDLSSGDFGYSIPVMSIPGAPGGTYPLALSYQAGIRQGQEASWVGLGWNLSPGSVSRFVRGAPDDDFGALKITDAPIPSVYSYGVGFGYQGFNIGVNWDNHGGFGGQIGYKFASMQNDTGDSLSGSVGLSYHNRAGGNVSGSLAYSGRYEHHDERGNLTGVTRSNFSISSNGSLSASGAEEGGMTAGVSVSSSGEIGFSQGWDRSSSKSIYSGQVYSSANYSSISLHWFNVGFGRTAGGTVRSFSESWGVLHRDAIGQSRSADMFGKAEMRRKLDMRTNAAGDYVEGADPSFKETFQERAEFFDQGFAYQRQLSALVNPNPSNETLYTHVGVRSDVYIQDFAGAFATVSSDEFRRESLSVNTAYNADYITPSFDGYSISAQGLSGLARPIVKNRGYFGFDQGLLNTAVKDQDGEWYFSSYRSLYHLLQAGVISWGADLQSFFKQSQWEAFEAGADNMVMLNDPGLIMDHHLFGEVDNHALQDDQIPGCSPCSGDLKHKQLRLENRSQRIRYELDGGGRIARIIVTKADGITYTFGLLQDRTGIVTAGARPMNIREVHETQRVDNPDDGYDAATLKERRSEPYAYAWYLAAVTSPDFVDNEPVGHFGPEDFGDYLTFHYALTNPSYHWQTPYGHDANSSEEQVFALIGRSAVDNKYTRERSSGTKDLYHVLFAKTRTHLAVFDHDFQRYDNLSVKPELEQVAAPLQYLPGYHFRTAKSLFSGPESHADQAAFYSEFGGDLPPDQQERNHLLLVFPAGTSARLAVAKGQTVPVSLHSVDPIAYPGVPTYGFLGGMKYLGSWDYSHHEVFQMSLAVDVDSLPIEETLGPFGAINITPRQKHGSISLSSIRLFRRDAENDAFFTGRTNGASLATRDIQPWLKQELANKHLLQTRFNFDYSTSYGRRNVDVDNNSGNTLTLKEVSFLAAYSDLPVGNSYQFEYYRPFNTIGSSIFSYSKDPWGYPSTLSKPLLTRVDDQVFSDRGFDNVPYQAKDSLASIVTPVGTRLRIEYEHDRYSWVQDRAALNRDFQIGVGLPAGGLATWSAAVPGEIQFSTGENQPLAVEQILAQLARLTWTWTSENTDNTWRDQVMVVALGSSRKGSCANVDRDGNCQDAGSAVANTHRFVMPSQQVDGTTWSLPIQVNQSGGAAATALHPGVNDLASWIWHEIDHVDGDLLALQILRIPGRVLPSDPGRIVPFATNFNDPYSIGSNSAFSIGEIGGGLRVKAIHTEPSQLVDWFGEQAKTTLTYSYEDPETGLDSGVIFADPPKYLHGVGGDQRIVRSESLPNLFAPGATVQYGHVTVRAVKPGMVNGATRYQLATAADSRVSRTMVSQSIKSYPLEIPYRQSILWQPSNPNAQLFRFHPRGDQDKPWSAIPMNQGSPVSFTLTNQVRNRIIHNGSLIGQVLEKTELDSQMRPISRIRTQYQAAFSPDEPLLPVKRFYRDATGTIREAELPQRYASDEGLNPRVQGAFMDKVMGFAMGRLDGDGYAYRVNAFMQDEIWNTFHQVGTSTEYFERMGDTEQVAVSENRLLANDFSTGKPAISATKVMSGNGNYAYVYTQNIPAHEIWDADGVPGGMKERNMLTQAGMTFSFMVERDLWTDQSQPWLSKLAAQPALGLNASLTSRRWFSFGQNGEGRWLENATLALEPRHSGTVGQVLTQLPLPGNESVAWRNTYAGAEGSRWQTGVQVTRYHARGIAVEGHDRLGNYQCVVLNPTGERPIAQFVNAKREQVFYEDFEFAPPPGATEADAPYPPRRVLTTDHQINATPAVQPDTQSAPAFMAQFNTAYTGRHAASGQIALSLDRSGFVKDPNRDYYLSFYCRPGGSSRVPVVLADRTLYLQLKRGQLSSEQDQGHVESRHNGWFYVLVRLENAQVGSIRLGSPGILVDAIALYPAGDDVNAEAFLNHFSYDPLYRQVESITDAAGRTVRYQYDDKGRLWRSFDSDGRLLSEHLRIEHERQ